MTYFKKTFLLNAEEKKKVADMSGKIMLGILNADYIGNIADKLHLTPAQVEQNIDENLYVLREHVGKWRYLKVLLDQEE